MHSLHCIAFELVRMQSSSNTMPYSNPNQCQPFLRSDIHEAHDNYHGHDDSVNPHGTRSSKLSSSMTFSTTSQADYHGLTFTSIKKSLSLLLLVGFVVTIIMMFLPNWTLASGAAAAADTQVQHLSYNLVTEQKQEENIIHESSSSSSSFSYNHDVYPLFQTQQRILNNNPTDIFCSNAQYTAISDLSYTYYLETTIGGNTNNNNNTSDDIIVDTIIQKVESSILNDLADTILFCRRSDDAGSESESGNGQTRHRQTKQGRRIQEMSTMKQQRRQHDDDKRQIQSIHTSSSSSSSSSLLERSYVGGEVGEENENGNDNDETFIDSLIDQYSLKVVGISSMPKDTPSTKSTYITYYLDEFFLFFFFCFINISKLKMYYIYHYLYYRYLYTIIHRK